MLLDPKADLAKPKRLPDPKHWAAHTTLLGGDGSCDSCSGAWPPAGRPDGPERRPRPSARQPGSSGSSCGHRRPRSERDGGRADGRAGGGGVGRPGRPPAGPGLPQCGHHAGGGGGRGGPGGPARPCGSSCSSGMVRYFVFLSALRILLSSSKNCKNNLDLLYFLCNWHWIRRIHMFLGLLDLDTLVRGNGSGSGSLYYQAKMVRKTLVPSVIDFFITFYLWNRCKCSVKNNF